MLGYHLGFGDKPRCTNFIVVKPDDFDINKYILNRVAHKPNGMEGHKLRN